MVDAGSARLRWPFYRRRSGTSSVSVAVDTSTNQADFPEDQWDVTSDSVDYLAAPIEAAYPASNGDLTFQDELNRVPLEPHVSDESTSFRNGDPPTAEPQQVGPSPEATMVFVTGHPALDAILPRDVSPGKLLPRVFRSSRSRLYLIGGSNDAAQLFTQSGFERQIDAKLWADLFEKRRAEVTSTGSKFAQLVVPEKLAVYPLEEGDFNEVFGGASPKDISSPGARLLKLLDSTSFFFPVQFLRDQRTNFPIYPLTDSHWTWQGAFSAFQAAMWELGYQPDYRTFVNLPKRHLKYHGDLWDDTLVDIQADDFVRIDVPNSVRRIYANPIVGVKEQKGLNDEQGLHMGSHCIFNNAEAEIKETLVLFGSSFSECRLEPSLLTAICCHYFETVHFVWSTSVDFDYVARHKPHVTIAEMPERFLTICPTDGQRIEDFAAERLSKWLSNATV